VRADDQSQSNGGRDGLNWNRAQFNVMPQEQAEKAGHEKRQAGLAAVLLAVSGDESHHAHGSRPKQE